MFHMNWEGLQKLKHYKYKKGAARRMGVCREDKAQQKYKLPMVNDCISQSVLYGEELSNFIDRCIVLTDKEDEWEINMKEVIESK